MHHATFQHQGAWSFGNSPKSNWYILPNSEVPAPGKYLLTQQQTVPAWTIGQAERQLTEISDGVGVGTYDPNYSAIFSSAKNPTIGEQGKRVRSPRIRKILPLHPKIQTVKPKAPAFSLGYKIDTQYDNGLPGPGDYENSIFPTSVSYNQGHCNFTLSQKIDPTANGKNKPGVGQYNISNKYFDHSPQHKFGRSERPEPGLNNSSPGIYYFTEQHKKQGGITMGYQLPISFIKKEVPPPNKYNLHSKKKYQLRRQKSMYTSNRSQCMNKTATTVATGPGSYNISGTLVERYKGRSFEQSQRNKLNSAIVPGPGSYDYKSTLNKTLGRMSWRHQKIIKFQTPAPGSYNITSPNSDRPNSEDSRGMPMALRPNIQRSTTNHIGPGQYEVSKRPASESKSFGRYPRRCVTTTDNPGPGYYEIPSTIGRIPKYFKNLTRKVTQFGETKIIKYDPKKFAEIKITTKLPPEQPSSQEKK